MSMFISSYTLDYHRFYDSCFNNQSQINELTDVKMELNLIFYIVNYFFLLNSKLITQNSKLKT